MEITIRKTWVTEEEIEAPDGLSEEELKKFVAGKVPGAANGDPWWDSTIALDEDDNELLGW